MKKKVSVIIPNYNGEKYLDFCIKSVLGQKYENFEIIIVDDGSTDNSKKVLEKYAINSKIQIVYQNNLNASIARNEGMKIATGDYLLFLDSDDYLTENILSKLMEKYILNEQIDLIIGNYNNINEKNIIIEKNRTFKEIKKYIGKEILPNLFDMNPVPTTKLYKMSVIKENNLYWGNVRIGQDLNFYLKYLLCCNQVLCIDDVMYNYRVLNNSISRSFDYKIYDIVQSFEDVKKFCKIRDQFELYEQYYSVLELRHYNRQIEKEKFFKTYKERKNVINFFLIQETKIDYKKCLNYNSYYKKIKLKFTIKKILKCIYASKIYYYVRRKL